MCHFAFIGLPDKASGDIIDVLAKSHRRRLSPAWMTITGHDLSGECFYTTAKYCDCGTSIGSRHRERPAVKSRVARRMQQWRKKNWSEAKIARAVASMSDENLHAREGADDTTDWFEFLNTLVRDFHFKHVSLALHWCGSESEFAVKETKQIRLAHIAHDALLDCSEDVLYVFRS